MAGKAVAGMSGYRTIVVDPPWLYSQHWKRSKQASLTGRMFKRGGAGGRYSAGRGAAANYDCMTLDELADMPINNWAEKNAHLYLWTTNAFLEKSFELARVWGFEPKTVLTWCKNQIGMGLYFRNSTEHVIFAVKGSLRCLRRDVRTDFHAPRGRHSEKPAAFYDMVETMSPGPYLDVFNRKRRLGWDAWGFEAYTPVGLPEPVRA